MKKYILTILSILTLNSCDLDLQPESSLTYNNFWGSEETMNADLIGIYSKFRDYNFTLFALGDLRSDIYFNGETLETPFYTNVINQDVSPERIAFNNWGNFYGFIHYLNDFIENAPKVKVKNEREKELMLAQVYGIRAFIYFTMMKTWGDVPITTEKIKDPTNLASLNKKRSPKEKVFEQVKKDIEQSLKLYGTENRLWKGLNVFWSKDATLALKGEAFLWSGEVLGKGEADFTIAKDALEQIKQFSLVPKYEDLWGSKNENNAEFIFALDYKINEQTNFYNGIVTGQNRDLQLLYNSEGENMLSFNSNGQNRIGPANSLIEKMYYGTGDSRPASTFIYLYSEKNNYPNFTPDKYRGAILKKFAGELVDGNRQGIQNIPLYRYADVVLMLAEAKNKLGQDPSTEINQIRRRAYGDNFNSKLEYRNQGKEANTEAILEERLKEFVGEGKRWWDLVRAGNKYIFEHIPNIDASTAYKIYYPISIEMINNDPNNLTQTEGYSTK
ncbi:RagB/SusD family nutrient uptake outer membrane protein [Ornithobacterium rhinotracheale]|uniref:RagB/SusD family nutrient uptake outer membrane protein n=1 Tax=Ornithobacterium rhinotracheale TaxID=28251 RepID=UPI001FF58CB3|nr:RagB/SusD family nutrient uptake outer membrane protein [Ornithobacterium rhinotracheale]MCK0200401.1 RagB/SusD family nutrient uptake outer membrane protein [Ornithobacterium rhinotracheale]